MFEKELERGPDQFFGGDLTASKAGGKSPRNSHDMAGLRRCLNLEGAIGLADHGDLCHSVTLDDLSRRLDARSGSAENCQQPKVGECRGCHVDDNPDIGAGFRLPTNGEGKDHGRAS